METEEVLLSVLAMVAGALCLWAALTGGQGADISQAPTVAPRARHAVGPGETTTRLRPHMPAGELPGDRAQRLPRREDLPWNQ